MLTWAQAREAAREFRLKVVLANRQWSSFSVEPFLPQGWQIKADCDDGQFHPPTIENLTRAIRWNAEPRRHGDAF